eukprot:COSAG02_NODE_52881_length_305_cov_0.757282_1_plen_26_part_10
MWGGSYMRSVHNSTIAFEFLLVVSVA